ACGCGWIQFICPLIWVVILEFGFCGGFSFTKSLRNDEVSWVYYFTKKKKRFKSKGSDTRKDLRIKGLDWCLGNGEKLSDSGCIEDIDHLFIQCNFAQQMYNTIVEMDGVIAKLHIIQEILLAEKKKLNIRLWMHIK
ncbi:hypothetical protein E1A91_A05G424600v1, partial [Gossypium mustelinum]